jgi:putative protease
MELLSPQGNRRFRLESMRDKHGTPLDEAPGGGWEVQAQLPVGADEMALLTRFLP